MRESFFKGINLGPNLGTGIVKKRFNGRWGEKQGYLLFQNYSPKRLVKP